VTDTVDTLFDEYAARWARGERPETADYLDRAGPEREALAVMIDRYLAVAPAREPDEATVRFLAEIYEQDEPPLLAARVARGLKVQAVVEWVMKSFSLPADTAGKVSAYWHELESGRRRPQDVAPELWGKVVELLGPAAEAAPSVEESSEVDEVDRLFGYGP
jgi:hypothetical protein